MHARRPGSSHPSPGSAIGRHGALLLLAAAFLLVPGEAFAHVKWFCGAVDLTRPPRAIGDVLRAMALAGGAAFPLLVGAGGGLDAALSHRFPRDVTEGRRTALVAEFIVRLGVGGYAVLLWNNTASVPWSDPADGAILTPELLDRTALIAQLQLAIALLLVLRTTMPLAGLGVAALYATGVARYGVFHMADYLYFLGLAGYLVLGAPALGPRLASWRVPVLTASLSLSLMWTAVEKFLYPQWTETVLLLHPSLTFGFPMPFVVAVAGFVEFSLAFYLLVGRALLRLDALALIAVFLGAIPEFGELDRVGHLPIVAILLVVVLRGPGPLQEAIRPAAEGAGRSTLRVVCLYLGLLAGLTGLYYALQRTAGWI